MKKVLIVGSINIDYGINAERFPNVGETIEGNNFTRLIGGKGCNQAIASHNFNSNTLFHGCIGNDEDGRYVKSELVKKGMSVNYIEEVNETTGVAIITRANGDNSIVINPGANHSINIDSVATILDKESVEYIVLQFETDMLVTFKIIDLAVEKGIKVILNTAPAKKFKKEYYSKIDYLIMNQTETEFYTGIHPYDKTTCREASKILFDLGASNVIITLGELGSYFSDNENDFIVQSFETEVVDSTGAGDAFVGVFASALNEIRDIKQALMFASKAGSLTCQKLGALNALPTRKELESITKEEK